MAKPKKKPPPPLTDPPWERQPGESTVAYEAFAAYRDLGPDRSKRAAAKVLGKSTNTLLRWAARWSWTDRTPAWDDHLDEGRRRGIERAAVDDGESWMRRRADQMERDFRVASEMQATAMVLIGSLRRDNAMTTQLGVADDDLDMTIGQKKNLAATLASAGATCKLASEIAWGAINAGVGDLAAPATPAPQGTSDK